LPRPHLACQHPRIGRRYDLCLGQPRLRRADSRASLVKQRLRLNDFSACVGIGLHHGLRAGLLCTGYVHQTLGFV